MLMVVWSSSLAGYCCMRRCIFIRFLVQRIFYQNVLMALIDRHYGNLGDVRLVFRFGFRSRLRSVQS